MEDKKFMEEAIKIAKKSRDEGSYPIGTVIVKEGKIISTGTCQIRTKNDCTQHSEIVAIQEACKNRGTKFLKNSTLYCTHEPCPMCAAACIWAKINKIVFGANIEDAKNNETKEFSWRQIEIKCKEITDKAKPTIEIKEEFMRKECCELFTYK